MTANQITAARVAAAFGAVALFTFLGRALAADLAAVGLTVTAIALDGVDGYIARTRGLASPLGAQIDILGDRIVENLFFTFFAVSGLVSIWVPLVFFVRGMLTDFVRNLAARSGRIGVGRDGMLEARWGRALVTSRASRASYAVLKCVCFCYLDLLLALRQWQVSWLGAEMRMYISASQNVLVASAIAFCILRAIPVLWDGHRYWAGVRKPASPVVAQVSR
jgi:CDP-diacylglycerol---glycerol-3-phosphate 3-phosphatidyltransferase